MYEVYALKYGERDTTACQFFYREASHESITLHYYVWLILGGPHPILVDTGFLDGDRQVLPGIGVHRVGGHTAGLQIVTVQTRRGTVVLTSDASHFYRNVETRQPVQIITSLPEMLAAFETIHALAGAERLIVAGHDPLVADRFKPVEPGIINIA